MEEKNKEQILNDLKSVISGFSQQLDAAKTSDQVEAIRVTALGRKSHLNEILKNIKNLDTLAKKEIGQEANKAKNLLEEEIHLKLKDIQKAYLASISTTEAIDTTLPGVKPKLGSIHPISQMQQRCEDIFMKMGFEVYYPFAVDDDFHNFESLNLPPNHPARDSWDTFWTEDDQIAITHTSSMQNRILSSTPPPIRAIVPGRCFRNEATDARHEHTFNQVEGIYVDKGITITDMLGTLQEFFSKFYEQDIKVKFTPDFFPFVEPGGMMSLSCVLCQGKGCAVCKQSGWLEILGCGMIHPKVLEMARIDSETYSGFAWGFGLERLVMLKYNINDIRIFNSGNLDFIKQF